MDLFKVPDDQIFILAEGTRETRDYRVFVHLGVLDFYLGLVLNFIFRHQRICENHQYRCVILCSDYDPDKARVPILIARQVPWPVLMRFVMRLMPRETHLEVVKLIQREGRGPELVIQSEVRKEILTTHDNILLILCDLSHHKESLFLLLKVIDVNRVTHENLLVHLSLVCAALHKNYRRASLIDDHIARDQG